MKYVEAMFVPSGVVEECDDAEVSLSPSAVPRITAAIKTAILESKAEEIDVAELAQDIFEIASEGIQIDEHHADLDPEAEGSFEPLDKLGSIRHKMMLAGIISHEIVAIVRLSDLTALIAERDRSGKCRD